MIARVVSDTCRLTAGVAIAFLMTALCGIRFVTAAEELFPTLSENAKTIELTISAEKEPVPALKYQFRAPVTNLSPGNSASHYLRAAILTQSIRNDQKAMTQVTSWMEMPLDKLPVSEIHQMLVVQQRIFRELELASQADHCDWGLDLNQFQGDEALTVSLEEFAALRAVGWMLKVKARLEIAESRFNEAVKTIGHAFILANRLSRVPTAIVNFIALSIHTTATDSVTEMIGRPGAPNLYWALRGLPDVQEGLNDVLYFDSTLVFRLFPFLKNPETLNWSAAEWQSKLSGAISLLDSYNEKYAAGVVGEKLRLATILLQSYPIAKQTLLETGYTADRVEAMPVGQVIAIYARDCLQHTIDQNSKCFLLPYVEASARHSQIQKQLFQEGYLGSHQIIPVRDPLLLNSRLGYASTQVFEAANRQQRILDALMVIEALRMHLAEKPGTLPDSLGKISVAAIPLNPGTNQAFPYRVVEQTAELIIPGSLHMDWNARRYLIRVP